MDYIPFKLGANLDTRTPQEAAAQDITAAEVIASAAAVDWQEMPKEQVRFFGKWIQNQHAKSDCVAETRRKLKRIMFWVNKGLELDFSSVAFYRKRSNYPGEGMIAADAIKLDSDGGMTLDMLVPSDAIATEAAANALAVDPLFDGVGKAFATKQNDVIFTPGDLDTPAGTIQKTRKGVMMWFYATVAEWSQEVPTILTNLAGPSDSRAAVVHSVTGVEPAVYQGQQGVWIDDSSPFGGLSRRFITRAFYEKRNWFASYPINFVFEKDAAPAYFQFSAPMAYGDTNAQVAKLQDRLRSLGFFPQNVASTGYYGALTAKAVYDWQKQNSVATPAEIDRLQGRSFGPQSIAKMNAMLS